MRIDGAIIREQGVEFAVVVVKPNVLHSSEREKVQAALVPRFRLPVVLMAQDHRGVPEYWGRPDIVDFLASVSPGRIPWCQYTLS